LPWGNFGMNNFDNRDFSAYPKVAEWCDKLFYSIKEIAPEIPVYLTVCVTHSTQNEWLDAFKEIPFSGYCLWNVTNTNKANLRKVYSMFSKYSKNLILGGVFQNQLKGGSWEEAKKITKESLYRVKEAGFQGLILIKQ